MLQMLMSRGDTLPSGSLAFCSLKEHGLFFNVISSRQNTFLDFCVACLCIVRNYIHKSKIWKDLSLHEEILNASLF